MTQSPMQDRSGVDGVHLVLYDGVCGLCNRLLQFLLTHDRAAMFAFASLQSAIGRSTVERFGGNPDELSSFFVVSNFRTARARLVGRGRAALFVAGELGWPWKAAVLFRVIPPAILDRMYDVVARNRYRLFGRFDRCLIPPPEYRRRFIDG
jgi:predicted DCC family thiol-disulfide oxidoreductase YuxK